MSGQLISRLTLDRHVYSINFGVETVNRTLYLFGIAQNQAEIDRAVRHAKNIPGVKRVVNHLQIKETKAAE